MKIVFPKIATVFNQKTTAAPVPQVSFAASIPDSFDKNAYYVKLKSPEGKIVEAEITEDLDKVTPKYKVMLDGKCLGEMECSLDCEIYDNSKTMPDYYIGKKCVEVDLLKSYSDYKGVGTELMKRAVRKSIEQGFEGRVKVHADTLTFKEGVPYSKKNNPLIFYYKLGFKSMNEEFNEYMEECIKDGISVDEGSQFMYLPRGNVRALLSK